LVDCGFTYCHRSWKSFHIAAASGVLKPTTPDEPVYDGYRYPWKKRCNRPIGPAGKPSMRLLVAF